MRIRYGWHPVKVADILSSFWMVRFHATIAHVFPSCFVGFFPEYQFKHLFRCLRFRETDKTINLVQIARIEMRYTQSSDFVIPKTFSMCRIRRAKRGSFSSVIHQCQAILYGRRDILISPVSSSSQKTYNRHVPLFKNVLLEPCRTNVDYTSIFIQRLQQFIDRCCKLTVLYVFCRPVH